MLIAMAVYDTEENNRTWMTKATLDSLLKTVDFSRHRLIIVDNNSCEKTQKLYDEYSEKFPDSCGIIKNNVNLGTAKAINEAWKLRTEGEHAVKMDNDVVIHQSGWANDMEEVFRRSPQIGICGLKRKDLDESPWNSCEWYKSELVMLPQEKGQKWVVVEKVRHVMGTCQAYSSALLDTIGYLYQMDGLYGFDDSLSALRSTISGFWNVFLHGIEIDHIDPGDRDYQKWKHDYSGKLMNEYNKVKMEYLSGKRSVYYDGL